MNAKLPNSFIYRYVPAHKGDLKHGKLQALQVLNAAGTPITVESQAAVNAPDQVALHSYGTSFETRWVTVHDTAVDGSVPFNANTAAKAKHATPFKRPENGAFRPGSHFGEFFFTETGDTNATSTENDTAGGWGSLFKLTQSDPSASTGKISVFFKGSLGVTGLDNLTFLSRGRSWRPSRMPATRCTRSGTGSTPATPSTSAPTTPSPANQADSVASRGRDPSATIDSASGGFGKNDGDNEITGAVVSNGDPAPTGSSARRSRTSAIRSGAGSTPSSTVTTSRTRSWSARTSTATTTTTEWPGDGAARRGRHHQAGVSSTAARGGRARGATRRRTCSRRRCR